MALAIVGCEEKTKSLEPRFESTAAFCASLVEHIIQHQTRCVGGAEVYHRRHLELRFQPGLCDALGTAVEAGDIRLQEARAVECLQLLESNDCTRWNAIESPCAKMFVGTRIDGDACDGDWVLCAPGSVCDQCTRICRPVSGSGGDCISDSYCESGLVCTTDDVCEQLASIGQPCTAGVWCELGAICERELCRSPKQENDLCDLYVSDGCGGGLACIDVGLENWWEGTCLTPVRAGDACVDGQCREPSVCEQGACMLPPFIGEPCSGRCVEGTCFEGICTELRELGERCESYQCRDGWCDRGICVEPIPNGGACTSWEQCGPDGYCFGGVCTPFETVACE